MAYLLDTLINGRYHDVAVYREADTAKLAAKRMPGIDGWRVFLDTRKKFKPVKGTTQPRVNSSAAFDAQVEYTVRLAQKRNREGVETRLVPIHVWPAPSDRGISHEFRRAVALALLPYAGAGMVWRRRKELESLLEPRGYEFIEVDPADWDPRVSCEEVES